MIATTATSPATVGRSQFQRPDVSAGFYLETGTRPLPQGVPGFRPSAEAQANRDGIRAVTQGIKLPFIDLPSFPHGHLSDRPPYVGVGIGRNGADSEPASGGGLPAPSNETISERPVIARWRREISSPVVTAESTTLPPTLLTPQRNPNGKNNVGGPEWPRIGVPAAWHCQQSHPPKPRASHRILTVVMLGGTAGSAKPPLLLSSATQEPRRYLCRRGSVVGSAESEVASCFSSHHRTRDFSSPAFCDWSFGYCLIAGGGQAASVGRFGIRSVPTDSCNLAWQPVS